MRSLRTFVGKVRRRAKRSLRGAPAPLPSVDVAARAREKTARERHARMYVFHERLRQVDDVLPKATDRHGDWGAPMVKHVKRLENRALTWGAQDAFFETLIADGPVDEAFVAAVRKLSGQKRSSLARKRARSLSQVLQSKPEFAAIGDLCMAVVAVHDEMPSTTWELLNRGDLAQVMRLTAGEYFRAGYALDPVKTRESLQKVLSGEVPIVASPGTWWDIAQSSFVAGDEAESKQAVERARAVADPVTDAEILADMEWLDDWFGAAEAARQPVEAPAGTIPFAVIDYRQPDRGGSSSNLGDHVQTIASLGHVVRHKGISFAGDQELAAVADLLRARVQDERIVEGDNATFSLYAIDRDATNYAAIPDGTWAIAFGWFMHPMFGLKHDTPLNPRLRPIFISFHINRIALLTPDMVEYLKKYAPVGCRDWNTVHLLQAAGVPAFFSGCLTTTIDTVFPPLGVTGEGTLWVDVPDPGPGERFSQAFDEVLRRPFAANVDDALARLESYRSTYDRVVTSRLHCYLPSRSIGANVDFRPKNPADVRFDGLANIDDAAYDAMRHGILDQLNPVISAIAAGRSDDEVYAVWREVCAPAVALAEKKFTDLADIAELTFDVAEACRAVLDKSYTVERSEPAPAGDEINVEFSLDGNLKHQFDVVLQSIVDHASRPIRLHVLCRDHDEVDFERVARLFPTVSFVWLPTDDVDYGDIIGMITHITVATMDRLLLPELLPDVPKIVHHDLDALCLADLAELFDTDLGDHPVAARTSPQPFFRSGFQRLIFASKRLNKDEALARELILRSHSRHSYDFRGFNAGIMVLNLDRMRADEFCRHFLPYAERFGMHDQEILNAYAGADRVELDDDWNRLPRLEVFDTSKIVHWAGPQKPWDDEYISGKELWVEVDQRVTARAHEVLGTR